MNGKHIRGAKDGRKRRVWLLPAENYPADFGYAEAQIEIEPGKLVRQTVRLDRVKDAEA